VSLSTGFPEDTDFVIEGFPVTRQDMPASDHDVDFARAGLNGRGDLLDPLSEGAQARRESRRHRAHRHGRSLQGVQRRRHQGRVDAHRSHPQIQVNGTQLLQQLRPQRLAGLGAQSAYPSRCVIAGKGGQVDHGHGA
jgi:hypothetical protein